MTDERTISVMRAIGGYDTSVKSLFVGGCVRNLLLEKIVADIDIATIHRPDVVMKLLTGAGIRALPTGLEHGTVTAVIGRHEFQITTLRRDVETDGRHAVIAFTDQWDVDAQRRDFTMNTLLASPAGDIFDPTGQGIADLDRRKVIFVGDPAQRIAEDHLRILRFFRFHGQYGQGDADPSALKACRDQADKIQSLSKERITQEFLKILAQKDAAELLSLMFDNVVLLNPDIRDSNYTAKAMDRFVDMQTRYEAESIIARLGLLCGFAKEKWQNWLVLSNTQIKELETIQDVLLVLKSVCKKKIRELIYRYGNSAVMQAYLVKLSLNNDYPDLEIIDIARYWQAPQFEISGKDLMERGIRAGPELGKKLKSLEEDWIKSDFKKLPKI